MPPPRSRAGPPPSVSARAAEPDARPIEDSELPGLFAGLERTGTVVLAVSGGADSLAMLVLATRWADRIAGVPPRLHVATVDHGLRAAAAEEARAVNVDPGYYQDCSDAVLLTSRGGATYDRTFMEAFLRPGLGLENWVSRSNYPALNIVETGPGEMSFYVIRNYGQPSIYLRRYTLRPDGFASIHAPYRGGEMVTRPLRFTGSRLLLNYSTSAPGGVRVEIQSASGAVIPGFALSDAAESIGDRIERAVAWKTGEDVSPLAGQSVRLRFSLKDADLYALRFT